MRINAVLLSSLLALSGLMLPTAGQAQSAVKVGTLRCNVSAGMGLIITSTRDIDCTFQPRRGRMETYRGTIRRFGLDIGATSPGVLVWGVVAANRRPARGSLAGDYVGATAEATAGVGLGVNALVGGSGQSYSLQPLSVEGQLGLNLAAGVAQMTLLSTRG